MCVKDTHSCLAGIHFAIFGGNLFGMRPRLPALYCARVSRCKTYPSICVGVHVVYLSLSFSCKSVSIKNDAAAQVESTRRPGIMCLPRLVG